MSTTDKEVKIGELYPQQYDSPLCFACGPESPTGLKLRFKRESEDSVSTSLEPRPDWTGWGDILHGGFQTLLLDETMSWTAHGILGLRAFVTKDLKIRFLQPVDVFQPLTVIGFIVDDDGKTIKTGGELRDSNNKLLTSAKATIVRVNPKVLRSKKHQK
ncbi:MAG: PaaI family thioesterase [Proteobacteria bacterium]|nr:PaaI family thioesterase [Pseudomonadota bacterium]